MSKTGVTLKVVTKIKDEKLRRIAEESVKETIRDILVDMGQDAVHDSPYKLGNNRRSIAMQVGNRGQGKGIETNETMPSVDIEPLQGALYSTSGYGGYLETGTSRMPARPYMNPARERHFTELKVANLLWHKMRNKSGPGGVL